MNMSPKVRPLWHATAVDVWYEPLVGLQVTAPAAVHFAARYQVGRQQLDARNVLDVD